MSRVGRIVRPIVLLPLAAAAVAGGFAGGRWYERREALAREAWADARLLTTAIDSVRLNALDSLPGDELIRRAVSGMLRELQDPYAALLRADGLEEYRGTLLGAGWDSGCAESPGGIAWCAWWRARRPRGPASALVTRSSRWTGSR